MRHIAKLVLGDYIIVLIHLLKIAFLNKGVLFQTRKRKPLKPKQSNKKKMINIKTDINKMKNKETIKKINKIKSQFIKKSAKITLIIF